MPLWRWNPNSRRYYVTKEGAETLGQKPGTFVSGSRLTQFRDAYIAAQKERTNELARQLASGETNLQRWLLDMREQVKTAHINEYLLARGGRNAMTQSDWGRIGQIVRGQYEYLDRFAQDIASGQYSEQSIAARARMYMESSSQSFERAQVVQRGMPDLPAYPGDGSTICLSNCKCKWVIRETDTEWLCTWTLSPAESCQDCLDRASRWAPYTVPKTQAATRSAVVKHLEAMT